MTRRLFPLLSGWLLTILLLCTAFVTLPAHAADEVEITSISLESSDDGYRLASMFSFDLPHGLEDAIMRGIPLYFTTDVELTRPRWYWFDDKAVSASRTVRISYDVLTRQYHAAISGHLQQSFPTLDDALSMVKRPGRWVIADKNELKSGQVYRVAVRMGLDMGRLPKPFQVHALNSSDWRLSSEWKQFSFRAD